MIPGERRGSREGNSQGGEVSACIAECMRWGVGVGESTADVESHGRRIVVPQ